MDSKNKEKMYSDTIIIERMYAGKYLSENIGHEIINTFKTDNGENYVYISPWGTINEKSQNTKAVIFVRLINQHCYEVIGYAGELSLILSREAMKKAKEAGTTDDERQRDAIAKNNISYGGLPVNDIFSEQNNTVYVTFKANKYRNVNRKNKIYIVDDEKAALNDSYIYIPEFRFSRQSLKLYAYKDTRTRAYEALEKMINTEMYWESENTSKMIQESEVVNSNFGILDIIGKSDDELVYSNWMEHYLSNFPNVQKRLVNDVLHIATDENMLVKREYHNIDLWLENSSHIIVIENKIKSGINGVDNERHDLKAKGIQSQLSNYYFFAEGEAKATDRETHYFIFLPDYSYKDEDLSVYLMHDKYTIVRYSEISTFFDSVSDNVPYIEEFRKALKKQASPYYKDLYQVMEERFINKIAQKKKKDI